MQRLYSLDSLRTVAILLVAIFHFYFRWSTLNFSDGISGFPDYRPFSELSLVKFGFLGVQLFFMISGYVIYMSLENSVNIFDFLKKRWIRLFPAMIICSIITYLITVIYPIIDKPSLSDFLPSLTFIQPEITNFLGIKARAMDGSYWSLFVEVRFYIIISILYFSPFLKNKIEPIFCGLIVVNILCFFLGINNSYVNAILKVLLLPNYLYWFLIGISAYRVFNNHKKSLFYLIFGIAVVAVYNYYTFQRISTDVKQLYYFELYTFILIALFLIALIPRNSAFNLNRPTFISKLGGDLSYIFYLLHQQIGLIIIMEIMKVSFFQKMSFGVPVITIVIIFCLSHIVRNILEKRLTLFLKKRLFLRKQSFELKVNENR